MSVSNPSNDLRTVNRLIEVWENVERVLMNLSEHDRTKHWDMSEFLVDTNCGTVGCAAGHCAMDPWFQAHGWKAVRSEEDEKYWTTAAGIHEFFGYEGSLSIFHDYSRRPVETVVDEVQRHIESLRRKLPHPFAYFHMHRSAT